MVEIDGIYLMPEWCLFHLPPPHLSIHEYDSIASLIKKDDGRKGSKNCRWRGRRGSGVKT